MKTYKRRKDMLIESPDGTLFVAHGSDDLYTQMQIEIKAGTAELIDEA